MNEHASASEDTNPMRIHLALVLMRNGTQTIGAACNRPGAYRMTTMPERITCLACKRIERWGDVQIRDDE